MSQYRVSQSKVNTFLRCQAAFHQKYILKLRKKKKSRALTFGSVFHDMLQLEAEGKNAVKIIKKQPLPNMLGGEQEAIETLDTALTIFPEYVEHWKRSKLKPIMKKGQALVECQFEIEILPDVIWNGRIDMYAREQGKLKWLVEHKTYSKTPPEDDRWRNFQSTTYFRAIQRLGWPEPDGVLWDYIRSSAPAIPQVLKNGGFSTREINTLPSVVKAAAKENGIPLSKAKGLLSHATNNGRAHYFQRIKRAVKKDTVDFLMGQFIGAIRGMVDYEEQVKSYHEPAMTIGRHCGWCDFRDICRARIEGGDPDYIISKEYTKHGKTDSKTDESRTYKKPYKKGVFI